MISILTAEMDLKRITLLWTANCVCIISSSHPNSMFVIMILSLPDTVQHKLRIQCMYVCIVCIHVDTRRLVSSCSVLEWMNSKTSWTAFDFRLVLLCFCVGYSTGWYLRDRPVGGGQMPLSPFTFSLLFKEWQ